MFFKLHQYYITKQRFAQDTRKIRAKESAFLVGKIGIKEIKASPSPITQSQKTKSVKILFQLTYADI